ncbi:hypothetical protein OZX56_07590 [Lactobacillus sp. ESL0684]|uniref:hypothetical protein n=1 Tax=Lactobacillus sp. ESL0684 TaxID=2983213 RepID=UPI0023F9B844|nr:hypothetical protein [Lactobacillus sp. ESL0684]WEV43356.1 hypothetical protein OZX56_07590 [Lactobacillus sp. ESL0684]
MMKTRVVQKRILWTILLVTVYFLGQFIIIPFIKPHVAAKYLQANTLIEVLGMYTGAQTSRPALLMLGIGPYMTTNIILQAINSLDLKSLRQIPQHTIDIFTNFVSLIVGILQAFLYVVNFKQALMPVYFLGTDISFALTILLLVTGGMISIFLANVITERGIGSSAVLLVPQLVLSLPSLITKGWGTTKFHFTVINTMVVILIALVIVVIGVILIHAEERIPLSDPQLSSRFAQSYFPIKLLTAGSMPFMFSTSVFMLLPMLVKHSSFELKDTIYQLISINRPSGIIFYALVIVILNFVFGMITLQPSIKARKLKENGNYFYHVIPGTKTEQFIMQKFKRLTWVSSLIIVAISVWPLVLGLWWPSWANLTPFIGNLFILLTIIYMIEQEYQTLDSEHLYVIDLK